MASNWIHRLLRWRTALAVALLVASAFALISASIDLIHAALGAAANPRRTEMLSELQSPAAPMAREREQGGSAGATPGPYLVVGSTVYALEPAGWLRGVEQFRNRFSAQVQGAHTPERELEAVATLLHAAPDLLAAAECDEALGMGEAGWAILERHGWDRYRRFSLTATEFVARLRRAAIAKATTIGLAAHMQEQMA